MSSSNTSQCRLKDGVVLRNPKRISARAENVRLSRIILEVFDHEAEAPNAHANAFENNTKPPPLSQLSHYL